MHFRKLFFGHVPSCRNLYQFRLFSLNGGFRLLEFDIIVLFINFNEKIVFFDVLIVLDMQGLYGAGDFGSNSVDSARHIGVIGGHVGFFVLNVKINADDDHQNHDDEQ